MNDKTFLKIFLLLTILYLAFQTKPWTSVKGNIYVGDDNSYYGYISSMVNDFDFDFSNNEVIGYNQISPVTGKIVLEHPIGTSILLMPFYIAAKPFVCFIHWITGTAFNQRHPLFFMFMCAGILMYAYLGGYLLFKAIGYLGINRKISLVAVTLCIWGTILPAYIFKRPIFSPIPQFFLISALLYFIVRFKDSTINIKKLSLLAILGTGVIITRWNDIHIMLFVIYFICVRSYITKTPFKKTILFLMTFCVIVFCVFFFTQGLAWKSFTGGYFRLPVDPSSMHGRSSLLSLATLINLFHIFAGLDWGILFTMLPFVIGIVGFLWFNPLSMLKGHSFDRIIYVLLFALPFIIVLKWRQQGSYYGYRHLLSLLPFACVGLAFFLDRLYRGFSGRLRFIYAFTIIILAFNFLLMLPFEYDESTTLAVGEHTMGGYGWVNNAYTKNALKIYFTSDLKTTAGMFMRGFAGAYIFAGIYSLFPDTFYEIADVDEKIQLYFAPDSFEKMLVLFYPFFAIAMLVGCYALIKRVVVIKKGEF